jgi:sulfur carrier protein
MTGPASRNQPTGAEPLHVTVNGAATRFPAGTSLAVVVGEVTAAAAGVAAAVDDEVVPRGEWSRRVLRDGERVEILTAVQGG